MKFERDVIKNENNLQSLERKHLMNSSVELV